MSSKESSRWDELYDQLRAIARSLIRNEHPRHTLQGTALVNEAWIRLRNDQVIGAADRTLLFNAVVATMKRVLIDHARGRKAERRGGVNARNVAALSSDIVAPASGPAIDPEDLQQLEEALEELAQQNPRAAEVAKLRIFGGLTKEKVAAQLDIAKSTAERDWDVAAFFLRRRIDGRPRA
jgi:RNA polymerase sigma factor (TIGR02999 family)